MKRHACAFRYQATASSTTIGWYGTWELDADADVINVWSKVALRQTRYELFSFFFFLLNFFFDESESELARYYVARVCNSETSI